MSYGRGAQILQESEDNLRILDAQRVTWRKFNTENPQILGAKAQSLVAMAARICSPLFSGEVKDSGYNSPDTSTTSPGTISLARIFCTPDLSALTTFPISGSYSFSASMADSAFRSYKFRRNITILRTCWCNRTWIKWKLSSNKPKVPEYTSKNKCNITFTDLKQFNESMGSKTNNIMAKCFTFLC